MRPTPHFVILRLYMDQGAGVSEAVELVKTILGLNGCGDLAARRRLIHPDCEVVMSGAGRLTRDELVAYSQVFTTAFPKSEHAIDRALETGDWVVIECRWVAAQTGPFTTPQGEIPATGRTAHTRLCVVCRVHAGRAVSIHGYWDQLEMLQQLGLVPEPEAV
jgi:ketosteroid isomerase-like protein